MDDRHIEEMLRESWKPEPPEGMRERVLRRARQELARSGRPVIGISRWRFAAASLALLAILLTGLSDAARQSRLSAMMDGASSPKITASYEGSWLGWHRELKKSLALTPTERGASNRLKGDGLL